MDVWRRKMYGGKNVSDRSGSVGLLRTIGRLWVIVVALAAAVTLAPAASASVSATPTAQSVVTTHAPLSSSLHLTGVPTADHSPAIASATAIGLRGGGWRGMWNYVQCITGIGIPAGVAVFIFTSPWTWPYVLGKPVPVTVGGTAYNYINWVKGRCTAWFYG